MSFCDLFSKNDIKIPKIRVLKNITVSLGVSLFQKAAKSFIFI